MLGKETGGKAAAAVATTAARWFREVVSTARQALIGKGEILFRLFVFVFVCLCYFWRGGNRGFGTTCHTSGD